MNDKHMDQRNKSSYSFVLNLFLYYDIISCCFIIYSYIHIATMLYLV